MQPARIHSFESLRGLMALWVVIGHVTEVFDMPPFSNYTLWKLTYNGTLAVETFFILSGFFIFHLLWVKRETYDIFIWRRFLRIFPVYAVCMAVCVFGLDYMLAALQPVKEFSGYNERRELYLQLSKDYFWPLLMAHLTMLHGLIPPQMIPSAQFTFVSVAWTISVEWQFYVLAPLAFWLALHKKRLPAWAALLSLLALLAYFNRHLDSGYMGHYLMCFVVGGASLYLWEAKRAWFSRAGRYANAIIVIVFLLLLARHLWIFALWSLVFLATAFAREGNLQTLPRHVTAILETTLLRWLGQISYSLYLCHFFILYAMLTLMQGADFRLWENIGICMAGTVAGTLLVSQCLYQWVEKPFIAFGRKN